MICERCGVVNRPGRTTCIHCLGFLKNAVPAEGAVCAEHPNEPATGRCVTCGKLVCEACGGVVSNRGVYCIDHTPAVTTSASASPGMNPLLSGGAGPEAAATAVRAKAGMDRGAMAAIAGLVALIVYFALAFGFPGWLRSGEVPASPAGIAAGGVGGPGGMGGMPGYGGDTSGAGPYGPMGSGGPAGSAGPYGGPGPGATGSSGPPGAPAAAPEDTSGGVGTPSSGGPLARKLRGPAVGD